MGAAYQRSSHDTNEIHELFDLLRNLVERTTGIRCGIGVAGAQKVRGIDSEVLGKECQVFRPGEGEPQKSRNEH